MEEDLVTYAPVLEGSYDSFLTYVCYYEDYVIITIDRHNSNIPIVIPNTHIYLVC